MEEARPSAPIELSVVLPCFDEEGNVEEVTEELHKVLAGLGLASEILYVDDASTDGTPQALARLAARYPELRVLRHAVNLGESAATATGFRAARGRVVVTMDADRQHDPADIPRLLAALQDADAVAGVRRTREDDWVKRLSSRIGNGFRNAVTGVRVSDAGCTYRALRRDVLADVPVFNGMHRFLPTLLVLQGYRVTELDVSHRPRSAGRSKYGVGNRMWRGLVDCLAMRWWRRRAVPGRRLALDADADEGT